MTHKDKRGAGTSLDIRIPVLSFFTGGGFLDIGFIKAGFDIVWTNENNAIFADMYEYGMTLFNNKLTGQKIINKISERNSIADLKVKDIVKKAFDNGKPKIFGVIGGPPCPDFSKGGRNKGSDGEHGRLTQLFVDRLSGLKPAFFVIENVPGLYRTKLHKKFLASIIEQLEDKGYKVDVRLLNSLDLGLAQDRERLFIIGVKKNHAQLCLDREIRKIDRGWFNWPVDDNYKNAKTRFKWPAIVEKGKKPSKPRNIPSGLMVIGCLKGEIAPEKLPNGKECFKPYSYKFKTLLEGDTKGKSFKRLHRYRYSPTACYGHNEVHVHPWQNRRLTVRESMRIQGIPDSYALPENISLSAKYKMISNGVPVPLAYHVALSLRKFLEPALMITMK